MAQKANIVLCATSVCQILTITANGLTTVLEAGIIGKLYIMTVQYTYQLSCLRRENHACESKTLISRKSRLQINFSHLTHTCELVALNDQFTIEKCKLDPIWNGNSPCKSRFNPRFTDFEGKSLEDCSFSVDPKRTMKLQNFGILRNFLGSFRKSSAIVGSSSETLALGRKKISRL